MPRKDLLARAKYCREKYGKGKGQVDQVAAFKAEFPEPDWDVLSERQIVILKLWLEMRTITAIAKTLEISRDTVHREKKMAIEKLSFCSSSPALYLKGERREECASVDGVQYPGD